MQASDPIRRQGGFDKVQMIGQQHPCLGIDQPLLPSGTAAFGQRQIGFGLRSAFGRAEVSNRFGFERGALHSIALAKNSNHVGLKNDISKSCFEPPPWAFV